MMIVLRGGLAVGAAVGLSACMIGPNYQRPPPADPPPLAFKETTGPVIGAAADFRPALPRDTIDRGPWWTMYGDPVLDGIAPMIDISNQTLIQAEANYRVARALVRQDASGLYPTVTATAQFTQSGRGSSASGSSTTNAGGFVTAGTGSSLSQFSTGPQLAWPIDVWGRIRRQIEADSASAQASASDLANARLSAQSSLATDYFSMRNAEQQIKLYQDTVAAYTRSLQIVDNQVNAGIASGLDLAQARTQLEQARALLIGANINRATFEHAIAVQVGKAPAEFSIEPGPPPPDVPTLDGGVPTALLERRPDIAAAERLMASANAQIGVAQAAFYPSFTLNASMSFISGGLGALLQLSNAVWSVGPQMAATLIDGGALKAQVESARAKYDSQVAGYRQTILVAFQQVEDALVQQRVLIQQEQVQRAAVAAAEEAVTLSLNQYTQGTIAYTTVVTSQTAALTAQQTLLSIRLSRLTASANLVIALGGGWNDTDMPAPYAIGGINQAPQPPMPTTQSLGATNKPWWKFWGR
ncbi:MAG: efflux transporter outer membrane subunit [Alphaproteobacteria bacterium]|nr:efflux transporter outer membrane subunit [Alphaproteobacteria bacterium]